MVQLPRAFTPHGLGAKNAFLDTSLNSDRTYLQGLPYMLTNLVNFGPEMTEKDKRIFAHLLNLRIARHCQTYRMDVI